MEKKSESLVHRRQFIRTIGALPIVSGAVFMSMCTAGCSEDATSALTGEKVTLLLANETALQNVGGYITRTFGANMNANRPVIVIRTAQDKFRAMSTYCPHEGGTIGVSANSKAICPRHGAMFGLSEGNFAQNIGGETTSSAQTYDVLFNQSAGSITISF